MSWYNIELALQKRLKSVGVSDPIFFENVKEDSSIGDHVTCKNFPTVTTAMDKTLADKRTGFYQVSLFKLTDIGKKNILDLTDLILSFFKFGDELTEGGDVVFIENSTPTPAEVQDKYYVVHLTIDYNSYSQR